MKKMKKLTSSILALTLCCGAALSWVGCKPGDGEDEIVIDDTKTQLYYSNYEAGIGRSWIEKTMQAFEEEFKNYSFEEGRVGVQVVPYHNRTDSTDGMYENLADSVNNIYFTEGFDYLKFVNGNKFYDITDVMTQGAITGVDANGEFVREQKTIESKIDPTFLEFLDTQKNGQLSYFAVPYYLGNKGVIFDKDLWNEKSFYFAKNNCPSEWIVQAKTKGDITLDAAVANYKADIAANFDVAYKMVNANGEHATLGNIGLSAGPDGKYDTFDDGLPATYDEFYALMNLMVGNSLTPIIWTGKNPGYADMLTLGLWQNDAGVEELKVYYGLEGTMDSLVKIGADGKIVKNNGVIQTESKKFDESNQATAGYDVQRSMSALYALQFAQKIAENPTWRHEDGYNTSVSHSVVEGKYLRSVEAAKVNKAEKRIAMLMDGAWWQQEASSVFTSMAAKDDKYSKANRDFGMLPFPNSTPERLAERIDNDEKQTVVSQNESYIFINGNLSENSPQLKVAKVFLSYMNSDKCLEIFTRETNMLRPVRTEFSDAQKAGFSKYCRNIIDYLDNSTVVYPYSETPFVLQNRAYINNALGGWNFQSAPGDGSTYKYPLTSIGKEGSTVNKAETYFEGMYKFYSGSYWGNLTK